MFYFSLSFCFGGETGGECRVGAKRMGWGGGLGRGEELPGNVGRRGTRNTFIGVALANKLELCLLLVYFQVLWKSQ
mgnify:CR=1 FL=1